MKLLVDHDLAALNAFLASVNVGDYVVSGQVESYSCASVVVLGRVARTRRTKETTTAVSRHVSCFPSFILIFLSSIHVSQTRAD